MAVWYWERVSKFVEEMADHPKSMNDTFIQRFMKIKLHKDESIRPS